MTAARVAAIGAHPDDELLGAGGTLARHVVAGDQVHAVVVADGAASWHCPTNAWIPSR